MSLLERLLASRLHQLRPSSPEQKSTDDSEAAAPTSLRLPADLRAELEGIADAMDWSMSKTIVNSLRAVTETDPLARQVILMRARVRHLAHSYGLNVHQMHALIPELTPDTLANDDLLARALTAPTLERISQRFRVARRWLEGHAGHSAMHALSVDPQSPVHWVQEFGPENVQMYWHAAPRAPWLTRAPVAASPDASYTTHLGLIAMTEVDEPIYWLVHHWHSANANDSKTRAVVSAIITQLHQLGIQQSGVFLTADQYQGLTNGSVLAVDVLGHRASGGWDAVGTFRGDRSP